MSLETFWTLEGIKELEVQLARFKKIALRQKLPPVEGVDEASCSVADVEGARYPVEMDQLLEARAGVAGTSMKINSLTSDIRKASDIISYFSSSRRKESLK